jgi:hypothetical protein
MSALVRFCGATYELMLAPSFRIGDHPTFSAAFLDISLSAAAILVTPGSALATLCRRVIQIGSLDQIHVLPEASYQTSAFDGRSIPTVCDACINGVQPRGLLRVNAEPGVTTEWLLLFDRYAVCMTILTRRRSSCGANFRYSSPLSRTVPPVGSSSRFQQPQEGRLSGAARANHSNDLANLHLDVDIVRQDVADDGSRQMRGFERDGLRCLFAFQTC